MTVDELVTKIRFDIDEKGLQKLQSLGGIINKIEANTEKMGKSFNKTDKDIKKTTTSTERLAKSFTKVALAAASALSVGATMRFVLNTADDVKSMDQLSQGIGVNTNELMLWGSAMESAGHDAKAFYADLRKLRSEYGSYDLDDVLKDASHLQQIEKDEGTPAAINEAAALGYSESPAKWLMQGPEAIKADLEKSRQLGHEISEEQIENSKELSKSYSTLSETLSSIGRKLTGEASPGLAKALDAITYSFASNQKAIEDWGKGASNTVQLFVDSITGQLGQAENRISQFNGMLSSDNMRSPDPEVREKERDERRKRAFWQDVRNNAGIAWDTLGTLGSGAYGLGAGVLTADVNQVTDSIADTIDGMGKIIDSAISDKSKITEPVFRAKMSEAQRHDDSDMYQIMARSRFYNANPSLREQADERARKLILDRYSSPEGYGTFSDLFTPKTEDSTNLQKPPSLYNLDEIPYHAKPTEEPVFYYPPPATQYEMSQPMSQRNGGEMVIENQEVNITIDGAGGNSHEIARLTAAEIRGAARNADFTPRRR